ncbi:GNAT family N-acetyltransferase [Glaciimonas soli]|uniref:GNAT family N-acetyltransferase n=1 Tax=Glaciimonas soli TaxID=2590999 RepID=A0A843YQH9_9BURK|nr:GNAT family N-acetyltransferase [Glaciimonas soli]MQR01785.1 GNAT family N-acetyltransferase [Glaciimonas soli]
MTSDAVLIRHLTVADAAAFRALRVGAATDAPSAITWTPEEQSNVSLEQIAQEIDATEFQIVFGAFINNQLIGITKLMREPREKVWHKASIMGVFVDPEWRGKRIARKLLNAALDYAHTRQEILQLQLYVNVQNTAALQLYLSFGFEGMFVVPRAIRVGDQFFDEQLMILRLR